VQKQERRDLEDIMDGLKTATKDEKLSLVEKAQKWIIKHQELLGTAAAAVGKAVGAALEPK
jgi:hypothetical protein